MKKIPLTKNDILDHKNLREISQIGGFKVAIFWSARIQPVDTQYQEIEECTKILAQEWFNIITGGWPGAMEAAAKGHFDACESCEKWRSIGINIELPHEQKPNKYLDIFDTTTTFSARLDAFMVLSDIFIVTGGGIGTLLELFYTWQLMQVGHICRAPIILWGKEYGELIHFMQESIVKKGFVTTDEAAFAIQVDTQEEVLALVRTARNTAEKLWDKACINMKQYLAGVKNLWLID